METTQTAGSMIDSTTVQEFDDINISLATSSLPPTGASEIACFIDAQLAFIAAASSVGVILILLTATIVLACNISSLKRPQRAPRPSRSNVDLVSGTGYWGTETRDGGIVGPCETSVLLEEVKNDEEEDVHDGEAGPSQFFVTTNAAGNLDRVPTTMQSSNSRDSCIDATNLDNMPLMV